MIRILRSLCSCLIGPPFPPYERGRPPSRLSAGPNQSLPVHRCFLFALHSFPLTFSSFPGDEKSLSLRVDCSDLISLAPRIDLLPYPRKSSRACLPLRCESLKDCIPSATLVFPAFRSALSLTPDQVVRRKGGRFDQLLAALLPDSAVFLSIQFKFIFVEQGSPLP